MSLKLSACCRLIFCGGLLVLSSGCAAITNRAPEDLAALQAPSDDVCYVRLNGVQDEIVTVPVGDETRVQDVLMASDALSEYRKPEITIVRKVETGDALPTKLRLVSHYDVHEKRVAWQSDYAVLAGDRITIREAPTSFERLLSAVMGK